MQKLKNLKWLSLKGSKGNNISAVAKLTKLESLSLCKTNVVDAVLEELANLKKLLLVSTRVSDIEVSAL